MKIVWLAEFAALISFAAAALAAEAKGPLTVLASNPRYFTDGSGRAIFLTGSHTWNNLIELARLASQPNPVVDFDKYLDFLEAHKHNCFRLWTWESPSWFDAKGQIICRPGPMPFLRTGPGNGLDGQPKFDLTKFNPAYFDRVRRRVTASRDRGMYVIVMLFQGYRGASHGDQWKGDFLNAANNLNGVDGDPSHAGKGNESHTLLVPAVTAVQEDYARKVIDTIADLDNVLYEITNEDAGSPGNTEWQYHMIRFIKKYETGKPKQHPVGMTVQWPEGKNETLFASPADWISPNDKDGYQSDPPVADGRKVILNDTDHSYYYTALQKTGPDAHRAWAWKNFARGMQTLFMDPYIDPAPWYVLTRNKPQDGQPDPYYEVLRKNMGYTRQYADRMNLAAMTPQPALASSGYCLASPAAKAPEYLVYVPKGPSVTVDLSGATGNFAVEWFNPSSEATSKGDAIAGGASRTLTVPFTGDAVLYLAQTGAGGKR